MKLSLIPVTIFAICSAILAMNFKPPTLEERLNATGKTEGLEENLHKALEPADDFEPIPAPQPGDWLFSLSIIDVFTREPMTVAGQNTTQFGIGPVNVPAP